MPKTSALTPAGTLTGTELVAVVATPNAVNNPKQSTTGDIAALAGTDTAVVASQAAMLALSAKVGSVAVRTDSSESYRLDALPATSLGNWIKIGVTSGATGIFLPVDGSGSMAVDPDAAMKVPTRQYADAGAFRAVKSLTQLLAADARDVQMLIMGDSTSIPYGLQAFATQWPGMVMAYIMSLYPKYTFQHRYWDDTTTFDYVAPVTDQTGTGGGGHTCTLYFAAVSGSRSDYLLSTKYAKAITAAKPDFIMVSHGLNEGDCTDVANGTTQQTIESFMARYQMNIGKVRTDWPMAGMVLIAQNIRTGETDSFSMNRKAQAVQAVASANGFGFVDIAQAWWDIAGTAAAGTYSNDGIHPTVAGHQIYADQIKPLFAKAGYTPRGGVKPPKPSDGVVWNMFLNGTFSLWNVAAGPPDGGTATNATVTQDTAHYMNINRAYSMRVQAASAAASFVTFPILNAFDLIPTYWDGKWVTAIGWRRLPAGQDPDEAGRIGLDDGVNVQRSVAGFGPFDDFVPIVVSMKISPTATKLDLILYGDSGAHSAADVSWDHVVIVPGIVSADSIPAPYGIEAIRISAATDFYARGGRFRTAAPSATASAAGSQLQFELRRIGEAQPRMQLLDHGIYFGDGTFDPRQGSGAVQGITYGVDRMVPATALVPSAEFMGGVTNADYTLNLGSGGFATSGDWYKVVRMTTTSGVARTLTVPELTVGGSVGKVTLHRTGTGEVTVAPANGNVLFYFNDGRNGVSTSFKIRPFGKVELVRYALSGWLVNGDVILGPRTNTINAPGATPALNTDLYETIRLTGIATPITSMTTALVGTPYDGQKFLITMQNNDTTARAVAWGASYANTTYGILPVLTLANATMRLYVALMWNASLTKFDCVGVS